MKVHPKKIPIKLDGKCSNIKNKWIERTCVTKNIAH